MKLFPTRFMATTEPLAANQFDEADEQLIKQLADQGYEVHSGLTSNYADQIAKMCLQPSIKEYCPNDAKQRFTNRSATEQWLSKGRCVFLLLKRQNNQELTLVGYGWAGTGTSSHVPKGQTTFAVRLGEDGQGQGLATPFTRLIVASTALVYGSKNLWLETWASNTAAAHIYHKLGFIDIDQQSGKRPTDHG